MTDFLKETENLEKSGYARMPLAKKKPEFLQGCATVFLFFMIAISYYTKFYGYQAEQKCMDGFNDLKNLDIVLQGDRENNGEFPEIIKDFPVGSNLFLLKT